jgi:hypothetical protein
VTDIETYLHSLFGLSREEIGRKIVEGELAQGFAIVKDAVWYDRKDWTRHTIISRDNNRIRLVALEAKKPGKGAFTRLIANIQSAGLVPVLVEPNQTLIDWCNRRDYRSRRMGKGTLAHTIWYPRA